MTGKPVHGGKSRTRLSRTLQQQGPALTKLGQHSCLPSCLLLAPPLPSGKQPGTSLDLWLLSTKGTPLSPPLPAFYIQREAKAPSFPGHAGHRMALPSDPECPLAPPRVSRGAWVPLLDLPRPRFHALWVQPPPLLAPAEGAALCLGQVPGRISALLLSGARL